MLGETLGVQLFVMPLKCYIKIYFYIVVDNRIAKCWCVCFRSIQCTVSLACSSEGYDRMTSRSYNYEKVEHRIGNYKKL